MEKWLFVVMIRIIGEKKYFQSTKQIVGKIERMTLRIGKLSLNYYMK